MNTRYELKRPGTFKRRKRIGCGTGSGHGKTSGKGQKGQLSRSGRKHYAWFEGGQMPLQRRIPKRGFNNKVFKKEYQLVNIKMLSVINASEITPEVLKERGFIQNSKKPVKVLSAGDISKPVKVTADAFSKLALEKIKKAGGEAVKREHTRKKSADGNPSS